MALYYSVKTLWEPYSGPGLRLAMRGLGMTWGYWGIDGEVSCVVGKRTEMLGASYDSWGMMASDLQGEEGDCVAVKVGNWILSSPFQLLSISCPLLSCSGTIFSPEFLWDSKMRWILLFQRYSDIASLWTFSRELKAAELWREFWVCDLVCAYGELLW